MFAADDRIQGFDSDLYDALEAERRRQEEFLELIASENYVSPRVLQAQGSTLTNKYADGYPGRRAYSGCEFVDVVEQLAIDRARDLFAASYANVQPYSGSQANAAAYFALMDPGDTLLGMNSCHGGHITHGDSASFSGKFFKIANYGVAESSGEIDYDHAAVLARQYRPKVIVAGFSAYSRIVDWGRFRTIADEVGAYLLIDMAHVAGLVAAGLYPSPVAIADVTTTTTHKTLRGPRGGMILVGDNSALADRIDAAVYPGTQGGPLMHVIAAKAVAFEEALQPQFKEYQNCVLKNASRMAASLMERGYSIVTGGTDNHMMLLDLSAQEIDAERAEQALERAHIAVNWLGLPGRPAEIPRGLRIGTAAITTRGIREAEAVELSYWIADILDNIGSEQVIDRVRGSVRELCREFPVYA